MKTKIKPFKKIITTAIIILLANRAFAQTYNPVWSLPPYYTHETPTGFVYPQTMQYSTIGSPIEYTISGPPSSASLPVYSHNMISDASGHNLIDILDGNVFDSTGNPVAYNPSDFVFNWAMYGVTAADPS